MMENQQHQHLEVQDNSTVSMDDFNNPKELKDEEKIKSSISVFYTDWVPEEDASVPPTEENVIPPFFSGSNTGTRYFHVYGAQGKVRPGLGTDPEDYTRKPGSRKRKKPALQQFDTPESINKKYVITPDKPAAAIINEINPNMVYKYQEVKAEKALPWFTCSVAFPPEDGQEFIGEGRSKKLAKNDAAEKVLCSLGVVIPVKTVDVPIDPVETTMNLKPLQSGPDDLISHFNKSYDFSSDEIINVDFTTPTTPMLSQPMVDAGILRRLRNIPNFEDNICLALNTIVPPATLEFEYLGDEGPPHEKIFTVKLRCNMQEYVGQGGSKKKAKADAAKKAVISLLGEECYKTVVNLSPHLTPSPKKNFNLEESKGKAKKKQKSVLLPSDRNVAMEEEDEDDCDDWGEYDLNFSDYINNVVREKYEELMSTDAVFSPYKVLAGVVMSTGSPMIFNSEVIAVTTGTKCIEGDFLSEQGLSINDSHAEILATRCVRDYFYGQIEKFESAKSDKERLECIIEENTSPERQFKYQLKCDVKFHLYISTSPCGDARIFSPKGIEIEDDVPSSTELEDVHPNKLNRGVLRSKIEAGEGTIPSANLYNGPQTWDSIVSGSALYTMSCSDKVCRWNVLGFQGALLYNLMGTVFYSSITLGSLHHPVHFKRAVFGRIEPLNSRLEIPFCVNKPKLLMVSREEKRRVKKSPNHAVCWSQGWSTPEILAANKGRCENGVASRLTKRMSFTRFLKLYNNHTGRREDYVDLTYHEAKGISVSYQKTKKEFVTFFQDVKLGPWIGKPIEQDSFKIN